MYYENYNYGGLLQAYALPLVLGKELKIDAEQIRFSLWVAEDSVKKSQSARLNTVYHMGIDCVSWLLRKKMHTRQAAFRRFMEDVPHSEDVYDYQSIAGCLQKYQALICGGDQIWNVCNGIHNLSVFTLSFAPGNMTKVAYAPSMAVPEMDNDGRNCMKQGLEGLTAVSVRERRSVDILKSITDQKIEIAADPVLLMTETSWERELRQPDIEGKYILCYLFNDSVPQRKAIRRLSRKFKLKIVTFPHILANAVRKCDLFFGDIHDYTSGPREFLGLMKNAEFVITDSYHACVFSMIFQTPFAVLARHKASEKGNMNSRIYDFLEEYHLNRQFVTEDTLTQLDAIPKIDFSYAHEHWKQRREESLQYLEKALKDNKNGAEQ